MIDSTKSRIEQARKAGIRNQNLNRSSYLPEKVQAIITNCLGYQNKLKPYSSNRSNQIDCIFGDIDQSPSQLSTHMSQGFAVEQDLAKPILHSQRSTARKDDDVQSKDSWSAMPSLSQESAHKVSKTTLTK